LIWNSEFLTAGIGFTKAFSKTRALDAKLWPDVWRCSGL